MGSDTAEPAWSITPSEMTRPGLVLLVSDRKCFACGTPKVYAEPTLGLAVKAGGLQATETCVNSSCVAALGALPLLKALQDVLKRMQRGEA